LGRIDEFTRDNEEMGWYYEPIDANKEIWLELYVNQIWLKR
jgi:hypothetical protein